MAKDTSSGLKVALNAEQYLRGVGKMTSATKKVEKAVLALATSIDKMEKEMKQAATASGKTGRSLDKTGKSAGMTSKAMDKLWTWLKRLVAMLFAAAGAVTVLAGKLERDFEQELVKVETLVGLNRNMVQGWRDDIIDLSIKTGQSARSLASALFAITSAGERGSQAIEQLDSVAKAMALGMGHGRQIARLAAAAVQAWGQEFTTAAERVEFFAKSMDTLVAAVRMGNLEADELTTTLGRAMGPAQQLGISFEELSAFVATFSRLGVPAAEAVTAVNSTFTTLIRNSDIARESLKQYGISIEDVRRDIADPNKGFTYTLIKLVNTYKGNISGLQDIISNIRALRGVLGAAASQQKSYHNINLMIKASQDSLNIAFERQQEVMAQSMKRVKAAGEGLLITMGHRLAPAISDVADRMRTAFTDPAAKRAMDQLGESLSEIIRMISTEGLVGGIETVSGVVKTLADNIHVLSGAITGLMTFGFIKWIERVVVKLKALEAAALGAWGAIGLVLAVITATTQAMITFANKMHQQMLLTVEADAAFKEYLDTLSQIKQPEMEEEWEALETAIEVADNKLKKLNKRLVDTTNEIARIESGELTFKEWLMGPIMLEEKLQKLNTTANVTKSQMVLLNNEVERLREFTKPTDAGPDKSTYGDQIKKWIILFRELRHEADRHHASEIRIVEAKKKGTLEQKAWIEAERFRKKLVEEDIKLAEELGDKYERVPKVMIEFLSKYVEKQALARLQKEAMIDAENLYARELTRARDAQQAMNQVLRQGVDGLHTYAAEQYVLNLEMRLGITLSHDLAEKIKIIVATTRMAAETASVLRQKWGSLASLWEELATRVTGGLVGAISQIFDGDDVIDTIKNQLIGIGSTMGEIVGLGFSESIANTLFNVIGPKLGDRLAKALGGEWASKLGQTIGSALGSAIGAFAGQAIGMGLEALIDLFTKPSTRYVGAVGAFNGAVKSLDDAANELADVAGELSNVLADIRSIAGVGIGTPPITVQERGGRYTASIGELMTFLKGQGGFSGEKGSGVLSDSAEAIEKLQGSLNALGASADSAGEAIEALMLKYLRKIASLYSGGELDEAARHILESLGFSMGENLEYFLDIINKSTASTFDELKRDLETGFDILYKSKSEGEGQFFKFFNELANMVAEGLRLGIEKEIVDKAVFNELTKQIREFSGLSIEYLSDIKDAGKALRQGIKDLGLAAEETARLLADAATAERMRAQSLKTSVLGTLAGYLETAGMFEKERLEIARKIARLEMAVLQAQLVAAGLWEKWGKIFKEVAAVIIRLAGTRKVDKIEADVIEADVLTAEERLQKKQEGFSILESLLEPLKGVAEYAGLTLDVARAQVRIQYEIWRIQMKQLGIWDEFSQLWTDSLAVALTDKNINDLANEINDARKRKQERTDEIYRALKLLTGKPFLRKGEGLVSDQFFKKFYEGTALEGPLKDLEKVLQQGTTDFTLKLADLIKEFRAHNDQQKEILAQYIEALKYERTMEIKGQLLEKVKDDPKFTAQWKKWQRDMLEFEYQRLKIDLIATGAWDELKDLWNAALNAEIQAIDSLDDTVNDLANAIMDLKKWRDSLFSNTSYSPFTTRKQLAFATQRFESLYARALGGDVDAIKEISGAAENVFSLAQGLYGNRAPYQAIFDRIISMVDNIIGMDIDALDPAQATADNTLRIAEINEAGFESMQFQLDGLRGAIVDANERGWEVAVNAQAVVADELSDITEEMRVGLKTVSEELSDIKDEFARMRFS